MFPGFNAARSFFSRSEQGGARSTVLQPLQWVLLLLLSGLVGCLFADSPSWLLVVMASMAVLDVVLIVLGFTYFALKNPDALRSENFFLKKYAIDRGLVGDDRSGIVEAESTEAMELTTEEEQPALEAGGE